MKRNNKIFIAIAAVFVLTLGLLAFQHVFTGANEQPLPATTTQGQEKDSSDDGTNSEKTSSPTTEQDSAKNIGSTKDTTDASSTTESDTETAEKEEDAKEEEVAEKGQEEQKSQSSNVANTDTQQTNKKSELASAKSNKTVTEKKQQTESTPPKKKEENSSEKPPEKKEEEQKTEVSTVTYSIVADEAMGTILPPTSVEMKDGDTVLDVLIKVTKSHRIQMSFRGGTGATAYIEGINNLYEFDRGSGSGWMYRVNGIFPNRGAGVVPLLDGDRIEWLYTIDLGKDLGAELQPFRD
ncbi:hypothetical protein FIU87_03695 [Bacillus sp. THAF10]|uniref:DUF4430 domain-containing protein n=1 Tax=Bacillus sp. THAF10 TaxID=2587848 RepID=UPI001268810D|nr:DUF4430 domain-containing protein [Bacillus sp. THAF10]QFT87747.1 hypothetical protein FIU87_03695 [Bacillus sp. THAF10]